MATFNLRCPKNYPRHCNLLENEKEHLERSEKYKAFLMYQFSGQDDYLVDTIKSFFHSPTYHVFDASQEAGLGIKICKICRLVQASDFGIMVLTPENPNAYLETGMMMGMGKRNLYVASRNILKAQNKTLKDIAFDLSDQLIIEHGDATELLQKLEKEIPPFIANVMIGTAYEREQRAYWLQVYNQMTPEQQAVLEFLIVLGQWKHNGFLLGKMLETYKPKKAQQIGMDSSSFPGVYNLMVYGGNYNNIILIENIDTSFAQGRINPNAKSYLEEIVFEEEQR